MAFFEGKEFSTITGEMPGRKWDRAGFMSDWETQIRANNELFNDTDIEIAQATVIKGFYDTYEELLIILEEEEGLTSEEKQEFVRKINLAMVNVLEYGQRKSKDIILSLEDRKLQPSEKASDLFNSIIDNLIFEVKKADKEFYDAREAKQKEDKKKNKP
jgi:hypothetical protein